MFGMSGVTARRGQAMTNRKPALARAARLHLLLPALAGSLFAYTAANAQSTGSQVQQGEVIVTGSRQQSTGGLAVVVKTAKDQSVVTSQFIATQVGSANFGQNINLLPGISYTSDDPTGVLSGDLRVHGFDGAHVSVTLDGTPLNDTGNYAIYPGEYATQEIVDHMTVNLGSTEVDSPTASAIGGTINIVTKVPSSTPGATASVGLGSYDYNREFVEVDTGAVGPTGIKSYFTANYVNSEKTRGNGDIERWGLDGRIYQPLNGSDFVSVAYTYASDRTYFYQSSSLAQIAQFGRSIDYNTQWQAPTVVAGSADNGSVPATAAAPGFEQGNDTNFWKLHPNPVDFGDLRGQSRFDLSHGVTLTVDPYFFYTLANGGGATAIKESDKRLIGSAAPAACAHGGTGVDLNGDGDCLDTVLVYSPSNTQTHRYGVNSSVIWDMDANNRFQLAYTLDDGHHRQTGEYTGINQATGAPDNVFGGKQGFGPAIVDLDGSQFRKRDRFSEAILNQFSVNYVGKFLDDKLHVNVGLRDPMFTRKLNEFCYVFNGASEYCDSVSTASVATALAADDTGVHAVGSTATNLTNLLGTTVKYGPGNLANFRLPFHQTYHFDKVLPNVGASYDFDPHNSVYATFTEGFSAPKTDDLYVSTSEAVQPETTFNYGVGYRYHSPVLTLSVNLWDSEWKNHIVQSFDPTDPTLSIDRNIGNVKLYGLDLEAGFKVTDELKVYASGTLNKSALQGNYIVATNAAIPVSVALPVKGKELVLTPDQTYALRAEYKMDSWVFGLDGKYTGNRFVDDINSTVLPAYTVFDVDAAYHFTVANVKSTLQFNVYNFLGTNYFNRSNTAGNFKPVVTGSGTVNAASGPFVFIGAPTTAYMTLKVAF
jgi:iron complex outermembrane receptor protein